MEGGVIVPGVGLQMLPTIRGHRYGKPSLQPGLQEHLAVTGALVEVDLVEIRIIPRRIAAGT